MNKMSYIVPLNLSKLGFRYFRILLESKHFSKKFIDYVVKHPNTGYFFAGSGWSGKKRLLGIGIWATSNAEISDIATNIRSVIPDSYKVVYQSELTRLEYFKEVDGERRTMVLLDELEQKKNLSSLEYEYLKLLSTDGSLTTELCAGLLGITSEEVCEIDKKLRNDQVFYGVFPDGELPSRYTKFFVDTTALNHEEVESYVASLREDPACVYFARGNGKYNLEFEYILNDEAKFLDKYSLFLRKSKKVTFRENLYTNLFPQSKSLNTKMVQEKFVELASHVDSVFNFGDSELWYVNHEGTKSYLDIYENADYRQTMKSGEISLFKEVADHLLVKGKSYNVIDLGSGDGIKGKELIQNLGMEKVRSYFPVDIQELELSQAVREHEGCDYAIHPTAVGFSNLTARFPLARMESEINIYALFGGTYGNFEINKINRYLQPLVNGSSDRLLIAMPIRDFVSRDEIAKSYLTKQIEGMSFGVLRQIGFSRDEFQSNPIHPEVKQQIVWEGNYLRTVFKLRKNKSILGLNVEAGTVFNITSSWKPTLAEFKEAVEESFAVERVISNRSSAIAICMKKASL